MLIHSRHCAGYATSGIVNRKQRQEKARRGSYDDDGWPLNHSTVALTSRSAGYSLSIRYVELSRQNHLTAALPQRDRGRLGRRRSGVLRRLAGPSTRASRRMEEWQEENEGCE